MAMKYHPDKVHNLGEEMKKSATDKFRAINEAYEHLKKQRNFV
jgi:DnaJ like chaperone protein